MSTKELVEQIIALYSAQHKPVQQGLQVSRLLEASSGDNADQPSRGVRLPTVDELLAVIDQAIGGLMPWLRDLWVRAGGRAVTYDRWIAWLAENLLSIACGLSVAAGLIFFHAASPDMLWQYGYAAAWPIFFILHFLQMAWKGKAPPKSVWIPALIIALVNASLLFTPMAMWQMFAASFVIHWYVNQVVSRTRFSLRRYLLGVLIRPLAEFVKWWNVLHPVKFLLDRHNNKKSDGSWDYGKLIPRILGLVAMYSSPLWVPYLAEYSIPGILQYSLDYLFGTDAGQMQLFAKYILLPILSFISTHTAYNVLVPWAQLSTEGSHGWRKAKYLSDDRVYAVQTGPNAPVPCAIEFSKEAVDALGVTPQLAQRILEMVSRQTKEGIESGRSLLLELQPGESLHNQGGDWEAVKLKMVTHLGEPPTAVPYTGAGNRMVVMTSKVQFNPAGVIQHVVRTPAPTGGGYLEGAIAEFKATRVLRQAGVQTALVLGVGEFTNLKFLGKRMGFVVVALRNLKSNQRLGDAITDVLQQAAKSRDENTQIEIVSKLYERISPMVVKATEILRQIHGRKFSYEESHIRNFSILIDGIVYAYDLESVKSAAGMSEKEFAYRILGDWLQMYLDTYALCMEDVQLLPQARKWQVRETTRLSRELVDAYFTLADREFMDDSRLELVTRPAGLLQLAQDVLGSAKYEGRTIAQINDPFVQMFWDYAERLYEHPDNLELTPRQPGYTLAPSSVPGVDIETYAHPPELSRRLSNLAGQHRGFEINYTGHGYTLRLLNRLKLENQANDRPKRVPSMLMDATDEESHSAFAVARKICQAKSVNLRQVLTNQRVMILGTGGTFQDVRNLLALAPGIRELVLLDLDLRNSMSVFSQMVRLPEEQRRKITIVRADIRDYPTTAPFDVIYTSNTLVPELFGDDLISVLGHLDGMLSQKGLIFGRMRVPTEQQAAVPFTVLASERHGQNQVRLELLQKNTALSAAGKPTRGRNLLAREGVMYTLLYSGIAALVLLGFSIKADPKIVWSAIVFFGGRVILSVLAEWLIYGRLLGTGEHGLTYFEDGKINFRKFWREINPKFGPKRRLVAYLGCIPAILVQAAGLVHEVLHSLIAAEWIAFLAEGVLFVSVGWLTLHGMLVWLAVIASAVLILSVTLIVRSLRKPGDSKKPGDSNRPPKFDAVMFAATLQELEQAKAAQAETRIQQAREKLEAMSNLAAQINDRVYVHQYDEYVTRRGPEPHGQDEVGLVEFMRLVREFPTTSHEVLDVGTSRRDLAWLSRQGIKAEGIDLSPKVIDVARKAGLVASVMDMRKLDYPDRSFQGVRSWASLHHLPMIDEEQGADLAVQEAFRVLVDGGVYTVSVKAVMSGREGYMLYDTREGLGPRAYQFYTPESLRTLLERNGFEILGNIIPQTRRDDNLVAYARKPRLNRNRAGVRMKDLFCRTSGDLVNWLEKISGHRRAFKLVATETGYRYFDQGEMVGLEIRDSSDNLEQHDFRTYDSYSEARAIELVTKLQRAEELGIRLEPLLENADVFLVSSAGDLTEVKELLGKFPDIHEITVIDRDLRNIDKMIARWVKLGTDQRRKVKLVRAEVAQYQTEQAYALIYVSTGENVFETSSEKSEEALKQMQVLLMAGGVILGDVAVTPEHILPEFKVLDQKIITMKRQPSVPDLVFTGQPGTKIRSTVPPVSEWPVIKVGKIYYILQKLVPVLQKPSARHRSMRPAAGRKNSKGRNILASDGVVFTLLYGAIALMVMGVLQAMHIQAEPKVVLYLVVFLGGRSFAAGLAELAIHGHLLAGTLEEPGLVYFADGKIHANFVINPEFGPVRRALAYLGYLPAYAVLATSVVHESLHAVFVSERAVYGLESLLFVTTCGFVLHGLAVWMLWTLLAIGVTVLAKVLLAPTDAQPVADLAAGSSFLRIELGKVLISPNANILAPKQNFLQSWPRLHWAVISFLLLGFNLRSAFGQTKGSRTVLSNTVLAQELGQRLQQFLPPNSIALADLLRTNHGNPCLEIRLLPETANSLEYLARLNQGRCWGRLPAGEAADYALYLPAELGAALTQEMSAGQNLSWLSRTLFEQTAALAGQNYYQHRYENAEQARQLQAYLLEHPNLVSHWEAAPALVQAWQLGLDQLAAHKTKAAVYSVAHCIVHELLLSEQAWLDEDLIGLLQQVDPKGNIRLEIISGKDKLLLWLPAELRNNQAILGMLRQKYPEAEFFIGGKRWVPWRGPRRQTSLQAA